MDIALSQTYFSAFSLITEWYGKSVIGNIFMKLYVYVFHNWLTKFNPTLCASVNKKWEYRQPSGKYKSIMLTSFMYCWITSGADIDLVQSVSISFLIKQTMLPETTHDIRVKCSVHRKHSKILIFQLWRFHLYVPSLLYVVSGSKARSLNFCYFS